MKIFIDDPSLSTLPNKLVVELTKRKNDIVESKLEDWIKCYQELYPTANIYYKGV